jgi:hypothetical protein
MKCAGQHETAECNLAAKGIKLPKEQLKCANCKLQHTANYGGCKVRKDFIKNQPKRKMRFQHQSPSTLDIVLSNELDYLSIRTELSSDHLPVLNEVTSDSRQEVPYHYIFNNNHAGWNQFKLIFDSRIDLDFI